MRGCTKELSKARDSHALPGSPGLVSVCLLHAVCTRSGLSDGDDAVSARPARHLPLLQSSLDALAAPALLLCLHFLPTAGALRLLGAQGALELRPLSLRTLQGGAARALLGGLQASQRAWAARLKAWLLISGMIWLYA